MNSKEIKTCCLCNQEFTGWGCNPDPLGGRNEGEGCCQNCDDRFVVPARLIGVKRDSAEARFLRHIAGLSNIVNAGHRFAETSKRFNLIRGGKID